MESFAGSTAIAGVGATEFSHDSGRSEAHLAVDCTLAALEDAGLSTSDVDGLVTYTLDTTPEWDLARMLNLGNLSFFTKVQHGGGAPCGCVMQAAMAVASGVAETVVVYRAFNDRSGRRFGQGPPEANQPTSEFIHLGWNRPFGHVTPASWIAMYARRYMHEYGVTSEDFGRVAVTMRQHAATNPKAWFHGRPITLEDHQNSRWVAEPLKLMDCCLESDGGIAFVITTLERARDLRQPPAVLAAAAQGSAPGMERMTAYYPPHREKITAIPELEFIASSLWRQIGGGPSDIDVAVLYDHFSPFVLMQLEALGFCKPGEAKDFVADGQIGLSGELPVNPNGGQLGEAYIHGMNGIAEAARQVRGTAANQISGAEKVLVTAAAGIPTSALVLAVDR